MIDPTGITDNTQYSFYAILYELSTRDFKRKLELFPEDLRYYVVLANGLIGAENAKRFKTIPAAVATDGEEFVSKLSAICDPDKDEIFRGILKTCLLEGLKDELRSCCPNCLNFSDCIGLPQLSFLADLFRMRVGGEETDELKTRIRDEIDKVLKNTPHWSSEEADLLCERFKHQYSPGRLGEVFGRYSEIGLMLQGIFGMDYLGFKAETVELNMTFAKRYTF